jgi:Spy/CpxP family protein refolding chaperone
MNRISGRRWMLAGLLAVAVGAAGVAGSGLAQGGQAVRAMHGGHDQMTGPAAMDAHFDKMFAEMLPDATPEQKTRLKAIVGAVHADIGATHGQFRQAHQRAHDLLLAPAVDRAGLERLRVEQVRQVDIVSSRLVKAFADAAEILTPEQRIRLAAQMKARAH